AASLSYFGDVLAAGTEPREAAVWMSGELARALNTAGLSVESSRIDAPALARLIALVREGRINLNTAKKVFQEAFASGTDPAGLVAERGLEQVSDASAIASVVAAVLAANAAEFERYRAGEHKVFGHLMGEVMRALKN